MLSELIEYLIANGHRLNDVLGYTVRQAGYFARLISQRKREELVALSGAVRMGVNAEKKNFAEFVKEMEDG